MNYYLAKLVYRIVCMHGSHKPQFDTQLRIIHAEDELHAFNKARLMGECENTNPSNDTQVPARWKFIDVTELHPLTQVADGIEIYSVISEEENAELYIRNTQKKASWLLQQGIQQFTSLNSLTLGI